MRLERPLSGTAHTQRNRWPVVFDIRAVGYFPGARRLRIVANPSGRPDNKRSVWDMRLERPLSGTAHTQRNRWPVVFDIRAVGYFPGARRLRIVANPSGRPDNKRSVSSTHWRARGLQLDDVYL
ncbi:hypothetical protein QE152_g28374 [Popillia japonica]|uniref:Uncharacterized protein n=1 Tax=Popillia japonica TaxID=7064 RepID=A0AAW1JJT0_POPJA